MSTLEFQVRKDALATTRTVTVPDGPLADGHLRVRIDLFAYTANNITYAAFGESMDYWKFFPASPAAPGEAASGAGWGIVPVWGFGEVVESRHPQVAVGERLYGYWPMASHAVLQPAQVGAGGFSDGAPHRAALHAVYNQYLRCAGDPYHTPGSEPAQALLRPLFVTAWLVDDFLADNGWFGAAVAPQPARLLLSSASSKTAYATAAQLARRDEAEVVALTSPRHLDFCRSLGVYHRVLAYEELPALEPERPCLYLDFAGNAALREAVHRHFGQLAYSCAIGGTHVEQLGGARDLPGPKPVLFFAPAQIRKRAHEWGATELNRRLVADWHHFRERATRGAPPWLVVRSDRGAAAVAAVHAAMLGGQVDPRAGHVLSLAPEAADARAAARDPG